MLDRTKPMYLGDIFNNTILLIKETFLRNLLIASIFFIPAGVVMAFGFDYFFSMLADSMSNAAHGGYSAMEQTEISSAMGNILFAITIYLLFMAVILFCTLCVSIGVTYISKRQLDGTKISLNEALQKIFSITFLRSIGQGILLFLILSGIIGVSYLLLIIGIAAELKLLVVLSVFFIIASFFIAAYFFIKWYFAFTAIVCDDTTVFESFSKSSFLVKNYWWRTFGLIILVSITVQFAISIVTTPISFIIMWDFISEYFKMIASGDITQNDPSNFVSAFRSIGFSLGIVIMISSILQYIIAPLFNVIMYYDLKIRKNDFEEITITQNGIEPVV